MIDGEEDLAASALRKLKLAAALSQPAIKTGVNVHRPITSATNSSDPSRRSEDGEVVT